jgi:hypothetical protein
MSRTFPGRSATPIVRIRDTDWMFRNRVTPGFPKRPSTCYMCAQEVHTYNNRIEILKQCLYKAEYLLH